MSIEESHTIAFRIFGETLRSYRKSAHISQSRFAAMIGINRCHLNRIECGEENPTFVTMLKIADGLDIPVQDLLNGFPRCSPRKLPEAHYEYGVTPFPPSNGDSLQGRS